MNPDLKPLTTPKPSRDGRSGYKAMFPPLLYETLRAYVLVSRKPRIPINAFIVNAVAEKLDKEGISVTSLTETR